MSVQTKSKIVFWIRMLLWVAVSCIVPISIFAIKFGLFRETGYDTTVDELGNIIVDNPPALNGWGIVSCIIVFWTVVQILKEVKDAYTGYSFKKQCLDGVIRLIPLVATICICFFLKEALDDIVYCLIVLTFSRLIAIPINPLPKWKYETKGVEDYEDGIATLVKHLKSKLKRGE